MYVYIYIHTYTERVTDGFPLLVQNLLAMTAESQKNIEALRAAMDAENIFIHLFIHILYVYTYIYIKIVRLMVSLFTEPSRHDGGVSEEYRGVARGDGCREARDRDAAVRAGQGRGRTGAKGARRRGGRGDCLFLFHFISYNSHHESIHRVNLETLQYALVRAEDGGLTRAKGPRRRGGRGDCLFSFCVFSFVYLSCHTTHTTMVPLFFISYNSHHEIIQRGTTVFFNTGRGHLLGLNLGQGRGRTGAKGARRRGGRGDCLFFLFF